MAFIEIVTSEGTTVLVNTNHIVAVTPTLITLSVRVASIPIAPGQYKEVVKALLGLGLMSDTERGVTGRYRVGIDPAHTVEECASGEAVRSVYGSGLIEAEPSTDPPPGFTGQDPAYGSSEQTGKGFSFPQSQADTPERRWMDKEIEKIQERELKGESPSASHEIIPPDVKAREKIRERELKEGITSDIWHYQVSLGVAACGADYPNLRKTVVFENVICPECRKSVEGPEVVHWQDPDSDVDIGACGRTTGRVTARRSDSDCPECRKWKPVGKDNPVVHKLDPAGHTVCGLDRSGTIAAFSDEVVNCPACRKLSGVDIHFTPPKEETGPKDN